MVVLYVQKHTRTAKYTLKFATQKKRDELRRVLTEYGAVVTHFISMFWDKCPRKTVRAPRIMRVAYGAIYRALIARGFAQPRAAVKISKPRLLLTILRYALL